MHSKCDLTEDSLPQFIGPAPLRDLFQWLIGLSPTRPPGGPWSLLSWALDRSREERVVQVVLGELTVSAEREGANLLRVLLTGKSASRDAGREIQPVFERLLSTAKEEGRTLVLHFEKLEYFNSSTIAGLVQFIRTAQQGGVRMLIRYDAALKWQAMSFDALRRALKSFEGADGPSLRFDGGDA
jgi:hypothetical protein